ncbi:uncharacterized protein LOC131316153 isoform X1 [Rhododendron vialii]|uniref:uncharacterized protein LOC131316153 isoform X1 n=1 Tax=Rhododendron vialii TaxID=182163 RepID=UPI00265E1D1B|nr:uncharacterized protein LOC131316153 isoform X1 [Rhododendron vialii]
MVNPFGWLLFSSHCRYCFFSENEKAHTGHAINSGDTRGIFFSCCKFESQEEDQSTENIQRIFGEAGNIKNICIRDPRAVRELQKYIIAEKLLSVKRFQGFLHVAAMTGEILNLGLLKAEERFFKNSVCEWTCTRIQPPAGELCSCQAVEA